MPTSAPTLPLHVVTELELSIESAGTFDTEAVPSMLGACGSCGNIGVLTVFKLVVNATIVPRPSVQEAKVAHANLMGLAVSQVTVVIADATSSDRRLAETGYVIAAGKFNDAAAADKASMAAKVPELLAGFLKAENTHKFTAIQVATLSSSMTAAVEIVQVAAGVAEANAMAAAIDAALQDNFDDLKVQVGASGGRFETLEAVQAPTPVPTVMPTSAPTGLPAGATFAPTVPTGVPTTFPTSQPTSEPTSHPTRQPTKHPTKYPTKYPTNQPTNQPTSVPTNRPTSQPTMHPTALIEASDASNNFVRVFAVVLVIASITLQE